jgi:predicted O-methyltransferase YrrM
MKIVALYKTFDGEEFVGASLASIYDQVSAIVMVHSDRSWTGKQGNRVREVAKLWAERNDHAGKIHHVDVAQGCQEHQYQAGIDSIAKTGIPFDLVMTVDCDEVWDRQQLAAAIDWIKKNPNAPAYEVALVAYIRSIFYRIDPLQGTPVVFLRKPCDLLRSPRAWNAPGRVRIPDVAFHHFTHVRLSEEHVREKIATSLVGDQGEKFLEKGDLEAWFAQKWALLPAGEDLHPFAGRESLWKRIKTVWLDQLPAAVRSHPVLMDWFLPRGELEDREEPMLFNLARQWSGTAVDLGTYMGRSATILSLGARRVITVDLFENIGQARVAAVRDGHGELYVALSHDADFGTVSRRLAIHGNIEVVQGYTQEAASIVMDRSVDLVFVDADHSEYGVAADFHAWFPKVVRGGLMLFHDVNGVHPEVRDWVQKLPEWHHGLVPYPAGDVQSLRAFRKVD